ncbi:hypothetical protein Tco_1582130, partial [Tanacetum coccineum]
VKTLDFSTLQSTVTDLQAQALKQAEASAAWAKSSTNMAWNLGSRMTIVEISQTALKHEVSSLRQDNSEIKSMMTETYQAFKGQPSSAPSGSVTPTLALTNIRANVEGGNATNTATEEPPSYTEGETEDSTMAIPISSIQPTEVPQTQAQPITSIITHLESSQKLVPASHIVRPDPDEPVKVEFMINGKMVYFTKQEIQEYWDKEEKMKKADEEAKLLAISKPEVIKVVQEEAEKIGLDPKKIASTKAGEKFKKAQDAEHQVLKREHSKKVKRLTKLNKRRAKEYMWTMTNKIKPKPITDIKIHPNTKPVVVFVFMNNDKRNFDVHNPFKFIDFGITELDELNKIPKELRIQSDLPAPVPEQPSSQTSGRKRKHMELEPK